MKYAVCKNGHSYDPSIYSACPQCGAKAVGNSGPVDLSLNDDSYVGPTMPVEHSAINRCIHCMSVLQNGETEMCPHCGQALQGADQPAFCLRPFSNLHGRYIAGGVLGQGGFGITYVGWDLSLDTRVAIKECYSDMWATRDHHISNQLQWTARFAQDGWWDVSCESFLKEARRMAKIRDIPGLVRVQDTFRENNTAYIVMDFVEGITLRQWLGNHGQLVPEECVDMLHPMIATLGSVHKQGFVHRDISPDNIMVQPDGKVRLLDFGAAKELEQGENYQSQLVVKKGYSPIEQYTENGNIGPWTDIYAICATMYFCMTGKTIPTALERSELDVLEFSESDSELPIPPYLVTALQRGLEMNSRKRIQSVDELLGMIQPPVRPKRNVWFILSGLAAAALIMVVALSVWKENSSRISDSSVSSLSVVEEGYSLAEAVVFREDAENCLSDQEYEKAADCYRQMLARGYIKDTEFGDALYEIAMKVKETGDFSLCRTLVEEGAEKGSAKAIEELGGRYFDGRGVEEVDYEKALSLFQQAAEMGLPSAMYNTGFCYENGYGTQIDETSAFNWYKKSAEAGSVWGMYKTGECYAQGKGTSHDAEQSVFWLEKYMATGNTQWHHQTAELMEQGLRECVDKYKATQEYEKAADCYRQMLARGYIKDTEFGDALFEIAMKVKETGDFSLCRTLVEEGAEKGSAKAIEELGGRYFDGRGVEEVDYEKALSLFQQAAEMGLPSAMYNTGICYDNGYGTQIDETSAFNWYKKSAEAGSVWGMYKVGMCYTNGIGTEADAEEASVWLRKYLETGDTHWREAALAAFGQ